ncbi:hypothetical protein [Persicobacter psychrovividus]|uniref:Alginate lyase domain-containing protein n=1 Tax=Persicobacter psychrovividus TaxID=387638 RepID=A0ABM7VM02_9BACT|nr:hypothetical protein PEPS_43190 [Persicobacter psychrovividus]
MRRYFLMLLLSAIASGVFAQPLKRVGAIDFSDWKGIASVQKKSAVISGGDTLSYTYHDQNRVYFPGISRPFHGDAADFTPYAGVRFDLFLKEDQPTDVTVTLKVDSLDYSELNPISTAQIRIKNKGWNTVFVPWDLFDIDLGQRRGTLFAVKHLLISANTAKDYRIKEVYLTKGLTTSLEAEIQGKSADVGTTVRYEIKVGNTTQQPQSVRLLVQREGWESMDVALSQTTLDMKVGEVKTVFADVNIPSHLPKGIREKQVIKTISNGLAGSEETIEFITAVRLPYPNIVFDKDGWQEIREKTKNYDWGKKDQQAYIRKADRWQIPKHNDFSDVDGRPLGKSVFNSNGNGFYDAGVAYQLTKNDDYARKCAQVLMRLSDPKTGYPATLVGGSNVFVGEGKFWQAAGRMYDMVRESEVFSEADHRQIQETFRLFVNQTLKGNSKGAISNWNVAELTAAFYCALNLQDWHLINQLLEGPTGIYKHIEHGIMNDGWWYECAVGYNTWVATELSEMALALDRWGINLKDRKFPIGTSKHFSLLASRRQGGIYGMEFEKWGAIEKNSVTIKDMWDATIAFLDYRGVIMAVNDAVESEVAGRPYELAYYIYRDPEYAAVIQRGNDRDLLYGVVDLPQVDSEKMKRSAYADNMGIVQLRSQTKDRAQREQIQASLHYGSHGGYHGHFDRTNLVNMARYGRSFYGTLAYWFTYHSYMYKFWKQTSINKNMVVVDEKMQLPVQNSKSLFYPGNMMQATVVETNSEWSYAPYGGIVRPGSSFAQKAWDESRSLVIPEDAPAYGEITGKTEPVEQRRALIVMDDYVVLADYLEGKEEHQFDWMFQVKGFKGITAEEVKHQQHTAQMNTDPLGAAQFITDCDWYQVKGTAKSQFEMCFGEGCDNRGVRMPNREDGPLKLDIYNAWPKEAQVMIGTSTESMEVNKKLWYSISCDGEQVLNDSTGAWILGAKSVTVDLNNAKELELISRTEDRVKNNTLFWGNARLILADGSHVYLSELPLKYDNIVVPEVKGKDYYGGPIKIQGAPMEFSTPAMPANTHKTGKVKVNLEGLNAVKFEAMVGGDFPLGDEASRLKNMAVRTKGKKARYLSVIEPFENESKVSKVTALSADELLIDLKDGRQQQIKISGLEQGQVKIVTKEFLEGQLIREEHSDKPVSTAVEQQVNMK